MASYLSSDVPTSTSSTAQPKATRQPKVRRRRKRTPAQERARANAYYGAQTQHHDAEVRKAGGTPATPSSGTGTGTGHGGGGKHKPGPFAKQIAAAVQLQYGEPLAALKRQQARVPHAYDAYRAIITGIANGQQAQYGQSLGTLGQFGNTLAAGSQGLIQQAQGAQAQGAAVTGATPSSQVDQDAAKAAIVRQGSLGSLGALIAGQGAAEGSYLGNMRAASVFDQARAQAAVDQALVDLKRERGAFKVKTRGDLKAAKAQAAADALKTQAALQIAGINSATDLTQTKIEQQTERSKARADRRADRRKDANAVNKWGYTNKEWRAMTPAERQKIIASQKSDGSGNGSKGAPTPKERKAARARRNTLVHRIGVLKNVTNPVKTTAGLTIPVRPTRAQVVNQLLTERGPDGKLYNIDEIRAAYRIIRKRRRRGGGQQAATYTPSGPGSDAAQG